jgi:hypothetical protein
VSKCPAKRYGSCPVFVVLPHKWWLRQHHEMCKNSYPFPAIAFSVSTLSESGRSSLPVVGHDQPHAPVVDTSAPVSTATVSDETAENDTMNALGKFGSAMPVGIAFCASAANSA